MTPAEEGAYIRLLSHAWMAPDCGLPDDDESLAELSRLRVQWRKCGTKIRRQFTSVGGRLFNNRLVEERRKQDEWRKRRSESGAAAAQVRWQGESEDGSRIPDECETDASRIPDASLTHDERIEKPMRENASSVFTLQSSIKTKPLHAADAVVKRVAGEIHCRHPAIRRDCSVAYIETKLRAVLKHRKISRDECEEYLERVNQYHRSLCESYGWSKDGGEFAKGLRNWLAPREGRYEPPPPSLLPENNLSMEQRLKL